MKYGMIVLQVNMQSVTRLGFLS